MTLGDMADKHRSVNVLYTLAKMKDLKVTPDLATYNALLDCLAHNGSDLEAWAVFDDMKAMGIVPDIASYDFLLRAVRFNGPAESWRVLRMMEEAGIPPQATTYENIINKYRVEGNLEMAIQLLVEMENHDLSPSIGTAEDVVLLAVRGGLPRLAIDLAENFEESSVRRLASYVWVKCLASAADNLYGAGVVRLWEKVVKHLKIMPDEGICMGTLHTAGRHGLPDLALDVLRVLKLVGANTEEHHFAPVIEAFCRTDRLKEAMATLSMMRAANIHPSAETAHHIFLSIQRNPDTVDAAWDALEALHAEGQQVDVTAVNVIIQASIAHGDLQRAVGIYQICPELNVSPVAETYNLLLSGCIAARHRELGDRILADMREANVAPDTQTFERLIVLCLTGQTYEDAFFYLEEMKSSRFVPPLAVYEAIIRRCVAENDSRYRLAIAELLELGYSVSNRLQRFIDTNGAVDEEGSGERRQWRQGSRGRAPQAPKAQ
ncbi:hypothetical protein BV25DRAFT_1849636 [Artomyces pyxidatus]|uniref:Uncharacterized protein n=1 Tax=Artomyces pyxidatus TaxID=48021 RepID=A0ACB8TC04_9AGAM|nr:hypothetical protein BV25DRAFT_1849636 [Artomyces pyxidatus]